jgi:hypothetical protein
MFNRAITSGLNVITDVTTAISGKPNNAKFVPTVTITVKGDNGIRLMICWIAEFRFIQDRNINESHLFHSIQFVFGEMEKFLDKNKEQFGAVKATSRLAQKPDIQEHLHAILKQLYSKE